MKTILEFTSPDDDYVLECALRARAWRSVVKELDDWLRSHTKYGNPKDVDADTCRDKLHELLNEECVDV